MYPDLDDHHRVDEGWRTVDIAADTFDPTDTGIPWTPEEAAAREEYFTTKYFFGGLACAKPWRATRRVGACADAAFS